MKQQAWFQATIRWAVMVEGREGLRCWEESIHIFTSKNQDMAFQHALQIGRQQQGCHSEGRRWVEKRLAQVVTLDNLGKDLKDLEVTWYTKKPTERLPFERVFDPEGSKPATILEMSLRREKTGGCYGSTERACVVPRASWRDIFRNFPAPRSALRPKRVALRAPQGFAPTGVPELIHQGVGPN